MPHRAPPDRKHRPRAVLALLALSQLIVAVDFDIVFVALPEIGRELDFSAQSLQWVVSAYTVALGGFLLVGGRAADRLGARRVFLTGTVVFGLSSLAGGLATSPEALVAARAVQGLGAAVLIPSTLKLINTNFAEGPARTRALAVWGIAGSSGAALGALGGGALTGFLGWEWVLFVNVPLALAASIAGITLLPADRGRGPNFRGFDLPGAVLATAGSTSVVFGLVNGPETGWATARAAGCLLLGAGLLAGFLFLERRSRNALVPLRMFRNRNLTVAVVMAFAFMSAIATEYYVFTTYLQETLDLGALATGLGFLPLSAFSMIGSGVLFPRLLRRWGLRTALLTGMAGFGASMAVFSASLSAGGSYWAVLPGATAWALFAGIGFPPIFLAASTGTATDEQGVATALTSTSQYIGGAVGLAVLVGAANTIAAAGTAPALVEGLRTAGLIGSAALVAIAFLSFAIPRPHRSPV
ncbi:drug resistance transporter, EmrB/QacA subfamily [Saccharopolyspora antimicrobica]|uniref:Drug resistance transporter, EmrB/QacA subfamily n=1 Tax=Saccharopolyspora antimicrobica TaxID=455193 RepID=A0A1I4ZL81_9PSEU|nr:MFS transporter [Saccharopolyspora antimicrobica]RKT83484.1 EmrB/QacA subfamily drug resistance transporter [Saccharopolyspora antimicrobica]SFN51031.1 drug resistance transporter, EmrB/QacA subfamily [Saccharopolyspora antimicrobica]